MYRIHKCILRDIIKKEFNDIEIERRENIKKLEEEVKDWGYLEQKDAKNNGRDRIEMEAVYNRKTVCWTTSLEKGLFYE